LEKIHLSLPAIATKEALSLLDCKAAATSSQKRSFLPMN
jgi:hypothetical protein